MNLQKIFENLRNGGAVSDASINAKKRQRKAIKNALGGNLGYNIKTFAIFTSENSPKDKVRWEKEGNSNNKELRGKENKKVHHELSRTLKHYGYAVEPLVGYYGEYDTEEEKWKAREHSFVVINISLESVKSLAGNHEQESFIFWHDGVSEYWQMEDSSKPYDPKTNKYVLADSVVGYKKLPKDQDNYYSVMGKYFKFSIPFPIFDSADYSIECALGKYFEGDEKVIDSCMDFGIKGRTATLFRRKLYERFEDTLKDAVKFATRVINEDEDEMTDDEMDEAVEDFDEIQDSYSENDDDVVANNICLMLENNDGNFYNSLFNALVKKAKRGAQLSVEKLANSSVVMNQSRKMRKELNEMNEDSNYATMSDDKKGRMLFAQNLIENVGYEVERLNEKQ